MTTKTRPRREPFGKIGPPKASDRGPVRRGGSPTPRQQASFDDVMDAEHREASARATAAEERLKRDRARNARITRTGGGTGTHVEDGQPPGSRRSGVPRPRRPGSSTRSINRTLRRFGGGNPRRVLVAELVAAMTIITVAEIAEGNAPAPSRYVAAFAVYLTLAFLAEFGDDSARLAAGMGGLILLALLLNHAGGILQVLGYLSGVDQHAPPATHPTHKKGA